jgi:hypothetical protein
LAEGGTNDFENLMSLCRSCHSKITAAAGFGHGKKDNFYGVTVQPPAIVYNSRDEQLRKADTEGLRECGTPDRGVEA